MIAESPTPRRWRPELWLLVALAGAVRFYGLRFGMPHVQARPDELVVGGIAIDFLRGDLNPHFWDYPTLFMYVLAVCDYAYYLFGRAAGWFRSPDHFLSVWKLYWTPIFIIARVVSAIAGTLTVMVVHRIAARLFDRLTAGVAALFLALAVLHVRDSHFGVTDVSMTLLVTVSCLCLVRGALEDRTWPFALAGIAAGAGASMKYNAVLMVAPLAAAVFVAAKRGRAPVREAVTRVGLFCGLFAAAFVAGTPYAILDHGPFMEGLWRQSRHLATPHAHDLGVGGVYHLVFSLRYGLGVPLLATALAGFVWLARADWRKALLLGSFPAAYYLLLIPTRTVFVRYAIPLVPFLCVSAAWTTTTVSRAIGRRFQIAAAPLAWVLALLIVLPSAYTVVQLDRLFATTDNRVVLADWLRTNVKPGSSIYLAGSIVVQPIVDFGSQKTLRYWTHREGRTFTEGRAAAAGTPDWLVIAESGVPEYSYCPPEVRELAAERYVVARVFKAMDLEGNLFDRQDAFYYPYAGFRNAHRGGPNYTVYVRKP